MVDHVLPFIVHEGRPDPKALSAHYFHDTTQCGTRLQSQPLFPPYGLKDTGREDGGNILFVLLRPDEECRTRKGDEAQDGADEERHGVIDVNKRVCSEEGESDCEQCLDDWRSCELQGRDRLVNGVVRIQLQPQKFRVANARLT